MYEKKNNDMVVLTSIHGAIEYMGNTYKLPTKLITDNSRIRLEKYDDTLLFYHALTNDLICKHQIPDGVGNIVSVPNEEKILSIEDEMHLHYKDDDVAITFLTNMRKQKPRYVYPQCDRLRRMQKYYTDEQIHIGMVHCISKDICTIFELSSYLLHCYGEEVAREYLNGKTYRKYLARSLEIQEESNG